MAILAALLAMTLIQTPAMHDDGAVMDHEAMAKPLPKVAMVHFLGGFKSPVQAAKQWVITSQDDFEKYWVEGQGLDAKDTPTNVDFTTNSLIAIHLGLRPTTNYAVFVKSIVKTPDGGWMVNYVEQIPRPLAVEVKRPSSPWVIVEVPLGPGIVQFHGVKKSVKYPPVLDNPPVIVGDPVVHPNGDE